VGADLRAKAHAIFTRVLSADSAERDAFILSECAGDPALEARVRRLVDSAARSEGFLDKPALDAARQEWPPIPDAVGNYLVIGVLGVGGMATVYEAIQENPHRHVALKVMHQSLSHTDAFLRFRLETQTLAKLRHPGIAQIYEAGAARLGRPTPSPFFAMELIPSAMSITQYAEHRSLALRDRLAMFASVCDAVLHGHQNGILHRDIKPANVLVGPDGHARVIDFGIARSMEGNAPALTGEGDTKRMIGTLNAMSPEQCLDPASIDVRSDVYSLGVLLFELVTGRLPHDLSQCSIPRAVQIITTESAPRASTIRPETAGDLDAIIAKSMDQDRARRYPGAGALAADIRRFLSHQPIEARPPTPLDRARKFARRNPPLAGAIGAALLLLLGGAAVSSVFAYKAARARDAAIQREHELETITAFQESIIDGVDVEQMGERLRESIELAVRAGLDSDGGAAAEASVEESLAAWRTLVGPVNFTTLAVDSLRDGVLARYEDSIDAEFAEQPVLRARLLHRLANTLTSLGLHADAERPLRLALELRRQSLGPGG
jgi:serine/threonine protein kinase